MILPDTNLRRGSAVGAGVFTGHRVLRLALGAVLLGAAGWFFWLYSQIEYYATHDDARQADAIAVFGAAEYDGRPSPVLRARLDHALELYKRQLAPLVITLGGGEQQQSEGAVGHDYLLAHGVPESRIIAETQSRNTRQSADRLAGIARENHLSSILAVSDGSHMFRIHALCAREGLQVFTSPRPQLGAVPTDEAAERIAHEMLSYTLWRLHLH